MKRFFIVLPMIALISLAGQAEDSRFPRHLVAAKQLLKQMNLANTSYRHGTPEITWEGACAVHADCSGFLNGLLSHCYGYDQEAYQQWFDSRRPSAARYHDAIEKQNGFLEVKTVGRIRPGDIIAVKYLRRKDNTGHVMLVAGMPKKMRARAPIIQGMEQWEVSIIDSSHSGHGPTDTRHAKGKDGKDHDGLGEGVLRLYADSQGHITGFSWSTASASKFIQPSEEHAVVGRLKG